MENLNDIFDNLFYSHLSEGLQKEARSTYFSKSLISESYLPSHMSSSNLAELFGKNKLPFSNKIGTHPDFIDLKEDETRNQYMVSMFLDISGSTKLGLKFPLEKVLLYKKAILESAIEIFQVFDAHIHRLQGDAIFSYFGHKEMKKSDAIINALNAASMMQAYNKSTLTKFFEKNNLEPLKLRVGIDIGDEHQVLWSTYGIKEISEVTSTSIHTDLAAKLQSKASRNSIMIGENVLTYLDLPDEFIEFKIRQSNGIRSEEKYVIQDSTLNKRYQMRVFSWEKYLNSFTFLPKTEEKSFKYASQKDFEIKCFVKTGDLLEEYRANSSALNKKCDIEFHLINKNIKEDYKIKWFVKNSGEEAALAEQIEKFEMESYKNNNKCLQSTKYNGHHYMICQILNANGEIIARDKFGVYINDDSNKMVDLYEEVKSS